VKVHEVVELAAGENLTFYDASYLYTARAYKAKLVTEDKGLLKFPESISVGQPLSELGISNS